MEEQGTDMERRSSINKMKRIAKCICILLVAFLIITNPIVTRGLSPLITKLAPNPASSTGSTEMNIIIKEIKKVGKLATIEYHTDVIIDKKENGKKVAFLTLPGTDKKLLAIAKGKISAGINMENINNESISINDKTVSIKLPEPEILSTEISETELWDNSSGIFVKNLQIEDYVTLNEEARKKIINAALEEGILEEAQENTKELLESFIKLYGFEEVIFM